jgi:hypothetical protein
MTKIKENREAAMKLNGEASILGAMKHDFQTREEELDPSRMMGDVAKQFSAGANE